MKKTSLHCDTFSLINKLYVNTHLRNKLGIISIYPVSYTHLDVYKRQNIANAAYLNRNHFIFIAIVISMAAIRHGEFPSIVQFYGPRIFSVKLFLRLGSTDSTQLNSLAYPANGRSKNTLS